MAEQHDISGWLLPLLTWREWQRRRTDLGSACIQEREAAMAWFASKGSEAIPLLRTALNGPIPVACGAALTLSRLDETDGIRWVLARCHRENWLCRAFQNGHLAELNALRLLGRRTVSDAMESAFIEAASAQDGPACQFALILALSALRLTAIFEDRSPPGILEQTLYFGPAQLRISQADERFVAVTELTATIRMEAGARLQRDFGSEGEDILIKVLDAPDHDIAATAIECARLLLVRRALPGLHRIAFRAGHPLAAKARRAAERIEGSRAAALTLVRAAAPPVSPEDLLRAAGPKPCDDRETLIRMVPS